MFKIDRLDHLVLTVASIENTCEFYQQVLAMERQDFGAGRVALKFGRQKINLHQAGKELEPHANSPAPGSADLCFITDARIEDVVAHLHASNILLEEGPVARTGATGAIMSVYFRDPDRNLIEVSVYN